MHDIKAIRADPEAYDRAWGRRGLEPRTPAILALDEARRGVQTALQTAQARRAEASREIGLAKKTGDDAKAAASMAEVETLKGRLAARGEEETELARSLQRVLEALPNLPDESVPDGVDEHGNVEVRRWGEPLAGPDRDHVELGTTLGLMDLDAAARMAGARFTVLEGDLARLQRALGQFMIDMQTGEGGYTEAYVPLLVRAQALYGTGQLPKFAEDLFRTLDDRWLIPTSEVSLANLAAGRVLDEETLPRRYTALTPCFRSEAGASGRDTRGMIRQHQFEKVELVSITTPEQSAQEHDRMVACAEAVLKRLELPFRTMLLCAGDMGFSARKTYDLEVWLASQKTYREISSCSDCGDFQARRMDARCKRAGDKGTRFVHTLNGSGLAVGRTLVAIMETYQDEGGAIAIPQALHPYLPGLARIERRG